MNRNVARLCAIFVFLIPGAAGSLLAQNNMPVEAPAVTKGSNTETPVKPPEKNSGWRLGNALGLPGWFSLGVNHRSRYEGLTNQFRTTALGDQPVYALRTLLSASIQSHHLAVQTEFIDARMYFAAAGTPLDTTAVNTFDILQGHAELKIPALLSEGDELRLRGGRFTLDLASRRLVARNRFRNTINSFTGFDFEYRMASGDRYQFFATMPVQRLPDNFADLQNNQAKLDYETPSVLFGGFLVENRSLVKALVAEFYALALYEQDAPDLLTRNRRLATPGVRIYRQPKAGSFDFETEGALQVGTSRLTTRATDVTDLKHFAFFVHASAGYSFRFWRQTRLSLEYHYASGNSSANTDRNTRFDALFGARRFMFGPTGLYGALALSNISTPGIRLEIKPAESLRAFTAYRSVWLAESTDAWTTSGLMDKTGNSGSFVGQQFESEISWGVLPGNLTLEAGVAYIALGDMPKSLAPQMQDPVYAFFGMILEF